VHVAFDGLLNGARGKGTGMDAVPLLSGSQKNGGFAGFARAILYHTGRGGGVVAVAAFDILWGDQTIFRRDALPDFLHRFSEGGCPA